jgi:hypothetical protein
VVDADDYASAKDAVRRMGLDPARVPHGRPPHERKARKARKPPRR